MDAGCDLRVECYAGYRGDERPLAFWVGNRRIAIQAVLATWAGEDGTYFRVRGDDGAAHVLRRDDRQDRWELTESGSRAGQDGTT